MAHIEGHPDDKTKGGISKYLWLIIILMVIMVLLSMGSMEEWREKIVAMLVASGFIVMIISIVTIKVNPMGWMKIFRRSGFERLLKADQIIFDSLQKLDDHHVIFYDFNFELLHVEILLIGPKGIFVIGKITSSEVLRIQDKILFAGKRSLMKKTGNLWRICDLINMHIQKEYKTDIMPKPILVVPYAESVAVNEYNGISIVTPDGLNALIELQPPDAIQPILVQGLVGDIKKRYT